MAARAKRPNTTPVPERRPVKANPTKRFFVEMLIRDIGLEDCILELVDNSIDGALKEVGTGPIDLRSETSLRNYHVALTFDADRFRIEDDCGGITFDDAANYAFTFGRMDDQESEDYSIGVYGIGMKRAIFKIGRMISIRSTYGEGRKREAFEVPINVDEWMAEPHESPWDFHAESAEPATRNGVTIEIDRLKQEASGAFADQAFVNRLHAVIGRDYLLHLGLGLSVTLNRRAVQRWDPAFVEGKHLSPVRTTRSIGSGRGKVDVEIVAGMYEPPPDITDPEDDDERQDGVDRSGWYVICNGRVVLAADKTERSGWGTKGPTRRWPRWHKQYHGFVGVLSLSSMHPENLPLTTTKRDIDPDGRVMRTCRGWMRDITLDWIDYTNSRKDVLPDARRLESEDAKAVPLRMVKKRAELKLPRLDETNSKPLGNVAYKVERERIERLIEAITDDPMTYKDLGRRTFEDAYGRHVEE